MTDETNQIAQLATLTPKKNKERSTIDFPYQDLQAGGIDVARGVFNAGGVSCEPAGGCFTNGGEWRGIPCSNKQR
jgi:hypothetical protein